MKIIKTGNEAAWETNKMIISGWFSFFCNFKCSYCINETYKKNYPMALSPKALENLMEYLPKLKKSHYSFSLAGGEALLYPHLEQFFSYLREHEGYKNKASCFVMTNGVLLDRMSPHIYDNCSTTVCISFHNEQADMDTYFDTLKRFQNPEICTVNLLMKHGEQKEAERITQKLNNIGYKRVWIRGILVDNKLDPAYTKNEVEYLFEKTAEMSQVYTNYYLDENNHEKQIKFLVEDFRNNHELVSYQGLKCSAGQNAIRVLPDGSVSPCVNIKATENFNLNSQPITEYPLLTKPFTCTKDKCLCPPYVTLAKWDPYHVQKPDYIVGD